MAIIRKSGYAPGEGLTQYPLIHLASIHPFGYPPTHPLQHLHPRSTTPRLISDVQRAYPRYTDRTPQRKEFRACRTGEARISFLTLVIAR